MARETLHRRLFLKLLGATGLVATTTAATGCAESDADPRSDEADLSTLRGYEFVVVGSGAGGGPLAANLARAGRKVLLLEAGDDQGANPNYQVPAFHAKSTEDETMRWDFFVQHYSDLGAAQKDSKFTWETPDGGLHVGPNPPAGSKPKGILYPRAGTLGGCTAHNAMITVYPHESDWDHIARVTGDGSWRASNMRRYFERLERCEYLESGDARTGHGFRGWLGVSRADAKLALGDSRLLRIIAAAAVTIGDGVVGNAKQLLGLMKRDLNQLGAARDAKEGVFQVPMAVTGAKRNGPREYLLDTVERGYPLTILTDCLATKVLFEDGADGTPKAIGVEFLEGKRLYRAAPGAKATKGGQKKRVLASREVILSAGAYNTPQLLKLSGIGPKEELAHFSIPVKVDLPGVGTNLQDRYEVGLLSKLDEGFSSLEGCTFGAKSDPCLDEWKRGTGPYTSNGVAIAVVKKSSVAERDPDLIVFGAPATFKGYYPGYADKVSADRQHFTWAVLKAHTGNNAGTVTLRSADPRDVPDIHFRYFDEGTAGASSRDVQAVVEGVELARKIAKRTGDLMFDDVPLVGGSYEEELPGVEVEGRTLTEFVKNEAWGHHASCTCPIGKDGDPNAVLDSRFRVRGTRGLRVVDASVFPRIPGFFIVTPIYMVSEKACDLLLEDNA